MIFRTCTLTLAAALLAAPLALLAQTPEAAPIYRVRVTSRTAKAVNYRQGSTRIDFKGTMYLPLAKGEAKVENKDGRVALEVKLEKMEPAVKFGQPYMTYVLWAITPEGKASNLGPISVQNGRAALNVTTNLSSFALIVTAEPYYAVTTPSEYVVVENEVRQDTRGKVAMVDAKYELFQRGYWEEGNYPPLAMDNPKAPFEYYEAENALRISRKAGAEKYAAESLQKALIQMKWANDYLSRKGNNTKPIQMVAREATQFAEDARVLTLRRIEDERLENERQAAAKKAADAKAAAEASELQRQQAELQSQKDAAARREADMQRLVAEKQKAEAERQRMAAELESAKAAAATAEAERLRQAAQKGEQEAAEAARRAEAEKHSLRASLLARFNQILETRDTDRGLVVNMGDVLFDVGKFTLRPAAREVLAKFSGILLAYPTLNVAIEGHTDSTGGDELNQRLSEQRAESVKTYLIEQSIPPANISAAGFGKGMPISDNATAAGRQKNRRVELIVSGEVIGTKISPSR